MKKSLTSRIMVYLIMIVILNVLVFIVTYFYFISSAKSEVKQTYQNTLQLFAEDINMEMENTERFVTSFASQTDFRKFCYLKDDTYFEGKRMQDAMYNALRSEKYISGIWVSSKPKARSLWVRMDEYELFNQYTNLRDYLEQEKNIQQYQSGMWHMIKVDKNIYLVYIQNDGSISYGSWANVSRILKRAGNYFKEDNLVFNIYWENEVLGSVKNKKSILSPGKEAAETKLDGNWKLMTLTYPLKVAKNVSFQIVFRPSFLNNIKWIVISISALGVVTLVMMGVMLFNMRHYFIHPVREIIDGIRDIGKGSLDRRINTENYVFELKEIGDNLNHMTKEITDLKIKVYEEELKKKDAQLQFYNAQIRPHFMLNVINTIYSLASIQKYEGILKTCQYLSGYMRYIFNQKELICTLEQEFNHLKEYILLQEIRYPDFLECRLELEPQILQCLIPTMSIHSIVENIFKYGIADQNRLEIQIKGTYQQAEDRVCLVITDNGPGFETDILASINQNRLINEKTGVGMRNTIVRFQELFPERFFIHISNEGGARVELNFPKITGKKR